MYLKSLDNGGATSRLIANILVTSVLVLMVAVPILAVGSRVVG